MDTSEIIGLLIKFWIIFHCGQLNFKMADCEEVDGTTCYCKLPLASPSIWLRREAEGNDSDERGSEKRDMRTRDKRLIMQEWQTLIGRALISFKNNESQSGNDV
ncbi:hypothetical protein TNCV_3212241 [Trichonephila clavipes]|nr:hypothetical protein TNCV_3212241 [Trichonephila clavipes]